jgi:3-mercaptopyruvate sulfurtransferase SseA
MARKKRSSKLPLSMLIVGGLFLVVTALLIFNQQTAPTPTSQADANIPYPEISRVTVEESKAAYDAGDTLFLDVRDPESYAANHIPGAINIPLNELPNRLGELNPDQQIITYCT